MSKWWERAPEHDKRIARGDDYAGDAWRYKPTGEIKMVAVGREHPNTIWPDGGDYMDHVYNRGW